MNKRIKRSAAIIICLTMIISVSAYSAEMAAAGAYISVAGELSKADKASEKAALEKYKADKVNIRHSRNTNGIHYAFLKSEVAYAIIPDNPALS